MIEEALYTWIFEGLKMGFGSTILVVLVLYLFNVWYYVSVVNFNSLLLSILFAAIPFLAAGIVGILSLSWSMAVAILLIGIIFTGAISELFKAG